MHDPGQEESGQMRSTELERQRCIDAKTHRKKTIFASLLLCFLAASFLSGCVRVAGTAGYWKTGQDGDLESQQASFDTDRLVQKGKTPGSVTI